MPEFTYDLTTAVGKVRLLCGDTDATGLTRTGGDRTRTDSEINAMLSLQSQDLYLAAAQVLESKAAEYSTLATLTVQGGIRLDFRVRSQRLLEAAALLRERASTGLVFNAASTCRSGNYENEGGASCL